MNGFHSKILLIVAFFLVIFLSGYWLSKSGQPLSSLKLTIHKLSAVAALVYLIVMVTRIHKLAPLSKPELTVCIVTALFFIISIATGGFLSIDKPMPAIIDVIHHIIAYLILLSTAATLYLFFSRATNP